MRPLILSLILVLLSAACSKKEASVSSSFQVVSGFQAILASTGNNGLIIYGVSNNGASFVKPITTDSVTLPLPAGQWTFYAVAWESNTPGDKFTGKTRCGKLQNITIADEPVALDIDITNENCKGSDFSAYTKLAGSEVHLPTMDVMTCNDLTGISSFGHSSLCSGTDANKGHAKWFKVRVMDVFDNGIEPPKPKPMLASKCESVAAPSNTLRLPTNLPKGSAVIVLFYSQDACAKSNGMDIVPMEPLNTDIVVVSNPNMTPATLVRYFVISNLDRLYDPRNFTVSSSETSAVMTWLDGGPLATSYRLAYIQGTTPPADCSGGATMSGSTHSLTSLTANMTYSYRVCSVSADGNLSKGITGSFTTLEKAKIVSITATAGNYSLDDIVNLTVTFNRPVAITGTVNLPLQIGDDQVFAQANAASLSLTHIFSYKVEVGQYAPLGPDLGNMLSIGGTIMDASGTNADLTVPTADLSMVSIYGCPVNWLPVPGNVTLGTSAFCVMKFEAKNESGVAVSKSSSYPWALISIVDAMDKCQSIDSNHQSDLISNAEWMTIARNIEQQPANWIGATVGTNALFKGHSDSALNVPLVASDDNNGYQGTGNSGVAGQEQYRILELSNGKKIWDFSGNVSEWVDWNIETPNVPTIAGACDTASEDIIDVLVDCTNFSRDQVGPLGDYRVDRHIGTIRGEATPGYARRGGNYAFAGIYDLDILLYAPTNKSADTGFRCVLRR